MNDQLSTMDQQEARGLLIELTEIKSTTRARLHAVGWQWLTIWSVAFLGAGVFALVPGLSGSSGAYWLVATPVSLALTFFVSTRVDSRSPVRQRSTPYWTVGAVMTVATFGVSSLLPDSAVVVVVWVILGLGFAAFAWLERVIPAAWLLSGMALVSAVLGLVVEDT
ncbi:MAG TPA: hypothetical protein VFT85_08255, partial [Acidimicrobiia bacterium]|nr:hypothetical protein [Acidimicrobiia bacterium]